MDRKTATALNDLHREADRWRRVFMDNLCGTPAGLGDPLQVRLSMAEVRDNEDGGVGPYVATIYRPHGACPTLLLALGPLKNRDVYVYDLDEWLSLEHRSTTLLMLQERVRKAHREALRRHAEGE